jgi:hypothetical protein
MDTKILSLIAPGKESFKRARKNVLKLRLNNEAKKLGEWVTLIHNVKEFLRRLDKWGRKHGHQFRLQPIEYFDPNGHHLPSDNIGFRKFDTYASQREARLLVRNLNPGDEVTTIDVGDISDCTMVLRRDDLSNVEINCSSKRKSLSEGNKKTTRREKGQLR